MKEVLSPTDNTPLAEKKLNDGLTLLRKYIPTLVPTQPTRLEFTLKKDKDFDAVYYGPIRNIHYIYLVHGEQDENNVKQEIAVCHELVHQWHAELMGPTVWWTFDPDAHISDKELESLPSEVLCKKLASILGADFPMLTDALAEGFASFIEIKIFEQYFREAAHGDHRRGKELRILKKQPNYFAPEYEFSIPYYQKGLESIMKVYNMSGLEGVINFIRNVDYEKCNRIGDGTKKYFKMLTHPERIPRLDKSRP